MGTSTPKRASRTDKRSGFGSSRRGVGAGSTGRGHTPAPATYLRKRAGSDVTTRSLSRSGGSKPHPQTTSLPGAAGAPRSHGQEDVPPRGSDMTPGPRSLPLTGHGRAHILLAIKTPVNSALPLGTVVSTVTGRKASLAVQVLWEKIPWWPDL